MNWWAALSSVQPMSMWGAWYSSRSAGWWRTSVFFKWTSNPKILAASAKQEGAAELFRYRQRRQRRQRRRGHGTATQVFCVAMQSPEVQQTAVKKVVDVYSIIIAKVLHDLFKYLAKKDAEQSQCQNTTLFHAVDVREWSREVTVQPNFSVLFFYIVG